MATYEKFEDGKSKDISDELPFDLPQGWAWARIGKVCYDFQYGTARKSTKSGLVPVLRMGNLQDGEIDYSDLVFTSNKADIEQYSLKPGDLLFNRTNSAEKVGKVSIFRRAEPCIFAGYLVRFRPIYCDSDFVNYVMNSHYQWEFCQSVKSDAVNQSNISASKFVQFLIPLPPISEQKLIVAKVKELFSYVDAIGKASEGMANTAERIDKKILDLAIRGQLVPQDPNDEPASELLKRIEAAKSAKAGGRVSSRAASDRPAYEIDPPYDIPDSWVWVRLKDLGVFVGGHTPSLADPSNWENGTVLWVTSKDMKQKYIEDTGCKVSAKGASELHLLPPGSLIMVTRSGILRRTFPVALASKPLTINQDQRALQFYDNAIGEYVYCCIRSFESTILRDYRKTGTTVESIIWEKFIDLPIPLPPLAEQKRIVAKVEELKRMTRTLVAS